ncbi:hypothetical protein QFC24_003014 [Naganishia onofrii]|uniref:Uncharacterized protein n=1 Tax=Naganishia onofrii TaxID=1851511 RepID=A0ACC2XN14_9TREE|nr:hypothetical protein QFC24_003014 [Naganishia onofrii]
MLSEGLTIDGKKLAPYDNARKWAETDKAERSALKQNYKDAGIALMVSAFGATGEEEFQDYTPMAVPAVEVAQALAKFVKDNDLDGATAAESPQSDFHTELRKQLPSPYIISHAPLAPWFEKAFGSCYVEIAKAVDDSVNFYNVHTLQGGTSLAEISTKANISPDKLVSASL